MDESSFLHSNAWQQVQEAEGNSCQRFENVLSIKQDLPLSLGFCQYIPRSSFQNTLSFDPSTFSSARFIRFELTDESSLERVKEWAQSNHLSFRQTPSIQPSQSSIIDLSLSEEDLLAKMKSKHRYNIKVARRSELECERFSGKEALEVLPRFFSLMKQTADRQEFTLHQDAHYKHILEAFGEEAHLLFTRHKETDLAALLLLTHQGTATYLHGGSSSQEKQRMAPYLLHFEAIEFAKSKGCTQYDLWGVQARQNTENEWEALEGHPSYGTSRFKLGFGGTFFRYPGCLDVIIQPFWYSVYQNLRALRGKKSAFSN